MRLHVALQHCLMETKKAAVGPPFRWVGFAPSGEGKREREGAGAQGRGETDSLLEDSHGLAPAVIRRVSPLRRCNLARLVISAMSKATNCRAFFATQPKPPFLRTVAALPSGHPSLAILGPSHEHSLF